MADPPGGIGPIGAIFRVIGCYLGELVRQESGWLFATRVVDRQALAPRD
jgi:hypothetical protein